MHDFYLNLYIIIKLKLKTGKCLIKIRFMTSVRITLQNYLYLITRTGYLGQNQLIHKKIQMNY
jgi:hypothetical protein